MRRRDVHVEHEVRVWERVLQLLVEEGLDLGPEGVPHREEEVEVVQVPLAHAEEGAVADEAAEFEGGVEVEVFAEDEVVGDLWWGRVDGFILLFRFFGRWSFAVGDAVVKGVFQVMRDKITALQEQVDVIRTATLQVVRRGDPCGVLGCTPVQLRSDFASQFCDCLLDLVVDLPPLRGRVGLFVFIL